MTARILTLALCATAWAAPVSALSLSATYSSLTIFGDSYSDTGIQNFVEGSPTPASRYFDGRWSNGPLWSDGVLSDFAPGATGNFAVGGARGFGTTYKDLPQQVAAFDRALNDQPLGNYAPAVAGGTFDLGPKPLAAFWLGINRAATSDPDRVSSANGVLDAIGQLSTTYGIMDFLVFDLPELGLWPGFGVADSNAAAQFNAALSSGLDVLETADPLLNITRFEVSALFDEVIAAPADYGFTGGLGPCRETWAISSPFCTDPDQRIFYDTVHVSAPMHDLIEAGVRSALAAPTPGAPNETVVPVPAALPLLALGLGALVAAGWRENLRKVLRTA